jgi:hypothetical protein
MSAKQFKFVSKCPCCGERIEVFLSKKAIKGIYKGFRKPLPEANRQYGSIMDGVVVRKITVEGPKIPKYLK